MREIPIFFASFMSGVYHPFIHLGYGLEFSSPMVVAEGLAITAMHKPAVKCILDSPTGAISSAVDAAMNVLASMTSTLGITAIPPTTDQKNPSALSIINTIYEDRSLDSSVKWEDPMKFPAVLSRAPEKIKEYTKMWVIDSGSKDNINARMKELISISMVLYSGTTRPGNDIKLDFFLMHSLTSALFLPIFVSQLTLAQAARILQAHFAVTLALYVSRGRPRLHLADNLSSYKSELSGYKEDITNPWLKVIERAIAHDDAHVVKALRSLVYGGTYLAHGDKGGELKETPEETHTTHDHSHYWLNSAKMTLDAIRDGRWWNQAGVGFDQVWDGRSDTGPNEIEMGDEFLM